jgi:hypothetical protein
MGTINRDSDTFTATANRITIPAGLGVRKVLVTAQTAITQATTGNYTGARIEHYDSGDVLLNTFSHAFADNGATSDQKILSTGAVDVSDGDYFIAGVLTETDTSITIRADGTTGFWLDLMVVDSAADHTTVTPVPAYMGAKVRLSADDTAVDTTLGYNITLATAVFDSHSFDSGSGQLSIPAGLGIRKVSLTGQICLSLATAGNYAFGRIIHYRSAAIINDFAVAFHDFGHSDQRFQLTTGSFEVQDGDYFELNVGVETDTSITIKEYGNATSQETFLELKVDEVEGGRWVKSMNTQTGTAYTLAIGDIENIVTMDNASANTVTIPANSAVAFPVGIEIPVYQKGAGQTTVTGDTGVTVNGVSAGGATVGKSIPYFMGAQIELSADDTSVNATTLYTIPLDQVEYDSHTFTDTANRLTIPSGLGIKKVSLTGCYSGTNGTAGTWTGLHIEQFDSGGTLKDKFALVGPDMAVANKRFHIVTPSVEVADGDYFLLTTQEESDVNVTIYANTGNQRTLLSLKVDEVEDGQYQQLTLLKEGTDNWIMTGDHGAVS